MEIKKDSHRTSTVQKTEPPPERSSVLLSGIAAALHSQNLSAYLR
jgi:hypothetical protein